MEGKPAGNPDLVDAARAGDQGALDTLFYRHRDGLFRFALTLTRDQLACEELVIDAFVRAQRLLAEGTEQAFRPILYRAALQLAEGRAADGPLAAVVLAADGRA
ncbi:MAG: hypothetical protein FJ034_08720, partial [Chloroflexi bacterium]|nr:hypothetical protein [Chloroflexota bacterium]